MPGKRHPLQPPASTNHESIHLSCQVAFIQRPAFGHGYPLPGTRDFEFLLLVAQSPANAPQPAILGQDEVLPGTRIAPYLRFTSDTTEP